MTRRCFALRIALVAAAAIALLAQPAPILEYIRATWDVLTRSHRNLASAAIDPKFHPAPDGRWIVYVPRSENVSAIQAALRQEVPEAGLRTLSILPLPADTEHLRDQGLLYLPRPYVVPGGRFNEMYGWDSYFIQLGLLRDGRIPLARDMADNFLYEIRQYGKILNANRTYYLSRSQPPFLTQMLLGVYRRTRTAVARSRRPADRRILSLLDQRAAPDTRDRPVPLLRFRRRAGAGSGRVRARRKRPDPLRLGAPIFPHPQSHRIRCFPVLRCADDRLTPLFYKGDRSMRESGFDPPTASAPSASTSSTTIPVCLNSLLYLMEIETAEIMGFLNGARTGPMDEAGQQRAAA